MGGRQASAAQPLVSWRLRSATGGVSRADAARPPPAERCGNAWSSPADRGRSGGPASTAVPPAAPATSTS